MRTLTLLFILISPAFGEEPIPHEKWSDVHNILTPDEMASPYAREIFIARVKHNNALLREQALKAKANGQPK